MANFNRVYLIGNLTRDPQLKFTQGGQQVAEFGLATNRQYRTQAGENREETTFVEIVVWGRQAEICNEYLSKGRPVFIEGRLKLDQWETQDGQKRSKLHVVAERFQFLGARGEGGGSGGGGKPSQQPSQQQQSRPAPQRQEPPVQEGPPNDGMDLDDIPF